MKKFFKIISVYLASLLCMVTLCGCSIIPSISLNSEQNALVSEYAAGLLLKYEKGHKNGLQRVDDMDFEVLNIVPTPTPLPTPEPEEPIVEIVSENDDAVVSDDEHKSNPETELSTVPLNEIFGFQNAQLNFAGGEICDEYPTISDDIAFSMSATLGNKLLILHFDLYNPSSEDLLCKTNLDGYKVRVLINETDKIRAEISLLQNDLINFERVLSPGENDDVVLVFEVPENTNIDSLLLKFVRGKEQNNYKLY